MKILLRYLPGDDEDEELETSFALTLPASWNNSSMDKLRNLFVDQFNKKHPNATLPMSKTDSHLETKAREILLNDTLISESGLVDNQEVFLVRGLTQSLARTPVAAAPAPAAVAPVTAAAPVAAPSGLVSCKRFGCRKKFDLNHPEQSGPCKHHKKPPVFHETRKFWACCPDKIGWDWDSFEAIEGCDSSPEHTNESATKNRFMGGTELRAEINGPAEIAVEKKAPSALDKLLQLRQALVSVGVSGEAFDTARDAIKRVHEDEQGKQVWDKVNEELAKLLSGALLSARPAAQ
ncbi:hypothetical protein BASA81_003567 [Batrachochytrium salamandrivorans]|nr:hypothetical protein BASA81_003567 [Batrachochytrium salamandrivorans]